MLADIHPYVQDLLDPLRQSRLAPLAERIVEHIMLAEQKAEGLSEERERIVSPPEETVLARGVRQLRLADAVVQGVLQREKRLFERNSQLVARLRKGLKGAAEGHQFKTIHVVEHADGRLEAGVEDLLDKDREEYLDALEKAWARGLEFTISRLETDGGR